MPETPRPPRILGTDHDTRPLPPSPADAIPGTSRPVYRYLCRRCNRLLAEVGDGSCVRIKCQCKTWNVIERAA